MAEQRAAYERSVLSEIRMLLDYVAGCGAIDLSTLSVQNPDPLKPSPLTAGEVLQGLDRLETDLQNGQPLEDWDFAFLQLVRDKVSRMARPATGFTVAFTALVAGSRRSRASESRAKLAQEAFPGLVHDAVKMRFSQYAIPFLAVVFTFVAIWVATQVALGKAILTNLDGLRVQQAGISAEKVRLEQALDKAAADPWAQFIPASSGAAGKPLPGKSFALCDRPEALAFYIQKLNPPFLIPEHISVASPALRTAAASVVASSSDAAVEQAASREQLRLYTSPEERDVCERDLVLQINFGLLHDELRQFARNWSGMVGGVFKWPSDVLSSRPAIWIWNGLSPATTATAGADQDVPGSGDKQQDVEFIVAPVLLVWGNYVLPIIFGFLGALMFVILDLYGKLKECRLDPRDNALSWLRLVLGLATGACIGLFVSSSGPASNPAAALAASGSASSLVSSLTLSASGLAFLAGFGVEGVFRMLQGLVSRVFVSDPGPAARS